MSDKLKGLYKLLSNDAVYQSELPSEEEFVSKFSNKDKLEGLYDLFSQDDVYKSEIGTKDAFVSRFLPKQQERKYQWNEAKQGDIKPPNYTVGVTDDGAETKDIETLRQSYERDIAAYESEKKVFETTPEYIGLQDTLNQLKIEQRQMAQSQNEVKKREIREKIRDTKSKIEKLTPIEPINRNPEYEQRREELVNNERNRYQAYNDSIKNADLAINQAQLSGVPQEEIGLLVDEKNRLEQERTAQALKIYDYYPAGAWKQHAETFTATALNIVKNIGDNFLAMSNRAEEGQLSDDDKSLGGIVRGLPDPLGFVRKEIDKLADKIGVSKELISPVYKAIGESITETVKPKMEEASRYIEPEQVAFIEKYGDFTPAQLMTKDYWYVNGGGLSASAAVFGAAGTLSAIPATRMVGKWGLQGLTANMVTGLAASIVPTSIMSMSYAGGVYDRVLTETGDLDAASEAAAKTYDQVYKNSYIQNALTLGLSGYAGPIIKSLGGASFIPSFIGAGLSSASTNFREEWEVENWYRRYTEKPDVSLSDWAASPEGQHAAFAGAFLGWGTSGKAAIFNLVSKGNHPSTGEVNKKDFLNYTAISEIAQLGKQSDMSDAMTIVSSSNMSDESKASVLRTIELLQNDSFYKGLDDVMAAEYADLALKATALQEKASNPIIKKELDLVMAKMYDIQAQSTTNPNVSFMWEDGKIIPYVDGEVATKLTDVQQGYVDAVKDLFESREKALFGDKEAVYGLSINGELTNYKNENDFLEALRNVKPEDKVEVYNVNATEDVIGKINNVIDEVNIKRESIRKEKEDTQKAIVEKKRDINRRKFEIFSDEAVGREVILNGNRGVLIKYNNKFFGVDNGTSISKFNIDDIVDYQLAEEKYASVSDKKVERVDVKEGDVSDNVSMPQNTKPINSPSRQVESVPGNTIEDKFSRNNGKVVVINGKKGVLRKINDNRIELHSGNSIFEFNVNDIKTFKESNDYSINKITESLVEVNNVEYFINTDDKGNIESLSPLRKPTQKIKNKDLIISVEIERNKLLVSNLKDDISLSEKLNRSNLLNIDKLLQTIYNINYTDVIESGLDKLYKGEFLTESEKLQVGLWIQDALDRISMLFKEKTTNEEQELMLNAYDNLEIIAELLYKNGLKTTTRNEKNAGKNKIRNTSESIKRENNKRKRSVAIEKRIKSDEKIKRLNEEIIALEQGEKPNQSMQKLDDTQVANSIGISVEGLQSVKTVMEDIFDLDTEKALAAATVYDSVVGVMAKRVGISKKDMWKRMSFERMSEEDMKSLEVKYPKAAIALNDTNAIIYAISNPDVSSPVHELSHMFEKYLRPSEVQSIKEWAGSKEWTRETSEKFAKGFEKYLYDGKAPTKKLQGIFDKFKQWLTDIYNGTNTLNFELNEPMKEIYDAMMGKEKKISKTVVVEESKATTEGLNEKSKKAVDNINKRIESSLLFQVDESRELHNDIVQDIRDLFEEITVTGKKTTTDAISIIKDMFQGKIDNEIERTLNTDVNKEIRAVEKKLKGYEGSKVYSSMETKLINSLVYTLLDAMPESDILEALKAYPAEKVKKAIDKASDERIKTELSKGLRKQFDVIKKKTDIERIRKNLDVRVSDLKDEIKTIQNKLNSIDNKSVRATQESMLINKLVYKMLGSMTKDEVSSKLSMFNAEEVSKAIERGLNNRKKDLERVSLFESDAKKFTQKEKRVFGELLEDVKTFLKVHKKSIERLTGIGISKLANKVADIKTPSSLITQIDEISKLLSYADNKARQRNIQVILSKIEDALKIKSADGKIKLTNKTQVQQDELKQIYEIMSMSESEVSERNSAINDKIETDDLTDDEYLALRKEQQYLQLFGDISSRTVDEIEVYLNNLNEVLKKIRSEGRADVLNHRAKYAKRAEVFAEEILGKKGDKNPVERGYAPIRKITSYWLTLDDLVLSAVQFNENSEVYNLTKEFQSSTERADNRLLKYKKLIDSALITFFGSTKGAENFLEKKIDVTLVDENGDKHVRKISLGQATHLWASYRSPSNYNYTQRISAGHMVGGQAKNLMLDSDGYTKLDDIMKTKGKPAIDFAAWVMDKFLPSLHPEISDVFKKMNLYDLPMLENYLWVNAESSKVGGDAMAALKAGQEFSFSNIRSGGTYKLFDNNILDIYKHTRNVAYYIESAELYKNVTYAFRNKNVKVAADRAKEYDRIALADKIIQYAYTGNKNEFKPMEGMLAYFSGRFAGSALMLNVSPFFNQQSSMVFAFLSDYMSYSGLGAMMMNPKMSGSVLKEVLSSNPTLKTRNAGETFTNVEKTDGNISKWLRSKSGINNVNAFIEDLVLNFGLKSSNKEAVKNDLLNRYSEDKPNQRMVARQSFFKKIGYLISPTTLGDKGPLYTTGSLVILGKYGEMYNLLKKSGVNEKDARSQAIAHAKVAYANYVNKTQTTAKASYKSTIRSFGAARYMMPLMGAPMQIAGGVFKAYEQIIKGYREAFYDKKGYIGSIFNKTTGKGFLDLAVWNAGIVAYEALLSGFSSIKNLWSDDEEKQREAKMNLLFDVTAGFTKGIFYLGFLLEYAHGRMVLDKSWYYHRTADNFTNIFEGAVDMLDALYYGSKYIDAKDKIDKYSSTKEIEKVKKMYEKALMGGGIAGLQLFGGPAAVSERYFKYKDWVYEDDEPLSQATKTLIGLGILKVKGEGDERELFSWLNVFDEDENVVIKKKIK